MSEGLFYFLALTISPPLRFGPALCPVAEEALGRQVSEHRRDGSATVQAPRRRRRAPRVQRRSAGSPDACVTNCSCLPGEPTPFFFVCSAASVLRPSAREKDLRSFTGYPGLDSGQSAKKRPFRTSHSEDAQLIASSVPQLTSAARKRITGTVPRRRASLHAFSRRLQIVCETCSRETAHARVATLRMYYLFGRT